MMKDLTLFANFFIDTEERFFRMKDSFISFYKIEPARWVINIRGRYKQEAAEFLKNNVKEELKLTFKHSQEGWFHDTSELLNEITTDYIFIWVEDHINIAPIEYLNAVINDIIQYSIESFYYSFLNIDNRFNNVHMDEAENIKYFMFDSKSYKLIQENLPGAYIIWYTSIMKTSLFKKNIIDTPKTGRKKWPKETPFDFEKGASETDWLPIKTGLPRKELFVSIDDDRKPGYSLQSRGLYPIREGRKSYAL